ncbi:MAG: helix-turn-helix transcriptional regulator [Arthrobacter sp.]|jgi:DNA-binding HxlR family transcriptional regulator|nr:helix-turn-helix transcriptional regulator [Arthrobacter sp.]
MNSAAPACPSAQARSAYEGSCNEPGSDGKAVREVLSRIGDKWSLLIIATLNEGPLRFTAIHQHIPGISQRMLTLTLKHLERDGLVLRTAYAEVPPRVEYELSAVGRTLIGPAVALAEWAVGHYPQIETARAAYDAR